MPSGSYKVVYAHRPNPNILYNKKCIADYREEDPFVGIYFNDLIDLLEEMIEDCESIHNLND